MKVRVAYTETVNDEYRMALRHHGGRCGTLATREEVRQHLEMSGASMDDDLMVELHECDDCRAALGDQDDQDGDR